MSCHFLISCFLSSSTFPLLPQRRRGSKESEPHPNLPIDNYPASSQDCDSFTLNQEPTERNPKLRRSSMKAWGIFLAGSFTRWTTYTVILAWNMNLYARQLTGSVSTIVSDSHDVLLCAADSHKPFSCSGKNMSSGKARLFSWPVQPSLTPGQFRLYAIYRRFPCQKTAQWIQSKSYKRPKCLVCTNPIISTFGYGQISLHNGSQANHSAGLQCRVACWMLLIWVSSFWSAELKRVYDPPFLENSRQCFDALPPVWWRWHLARTLVGGNVFVVASDSAANLRKW